MERSSSPISHARLGTLSGDPEGLRLVQRRVGQYAAIVGSLSLAFYVAIGIGLLSDPSLARSAAFVGPGRVEHLVGTLIVLGVALYARLTPAMSLRMLGVVDALGIVAPGLAWAMMILRFGTVPGAPSGWLAVSFAVIGRAIVVPSTVFRTARISVIALCPQPLVAYALVTRPQSIGPGGALEVPSSTAAFQFVVESVLWSVAAVVIATYASHVIYGLREEVRQARRLGQYILVKRLGVGGMGEVYLARHALLRRPTAIKLIRNGQGGKDRVARFEREVQRTAELTHPNTVQVYDYGHTSDGVFYYAMEYLEGVDLEKLVRTHGALPPARVLHILDQACASLAEAHEKGLVHRDVKPANLILCTRGGAHDTLKVVDFGLVKDSADTTKSKATRGDRIVGTPHYLAPEAITDPAQVDGRTDLYALGAVAYFLLTGREVFEGKSMVAVLTKHLHEAPAPIASRLGRAIPEDLEALVLACLAKSPADRPKSAAELRRRVRACEDFGVWTEPTARAWWADEGRGLLGPDAQPSVSEDSRALGVDLGDRRAADPALEATLQVTLPSAELPKGVAESGELQASGSSA